MTDEMAIQQQRPSAMPYLLGGAAIGGAGGAATAKYANFGIESPKYKSWQDAVADVNKDDTFIKKQIEKGGDNKTNWETIKNSAKEVKDADKAVNDFKMPDGFEAKAELDDVIGKEIALDDAKDAVKKKEKEVFDKELKALKEMPIEEGKPYEFKGVKYNQEEFRKLLNSTEEADQNLVKELVENTQKYKDEIGKADFAKTEKEAVTKAQEALVKAEEELTKKDTKGLANGIRDSYSTVKKGAASARLTASEKITGDVLKNCKSASGWKTGLAAAAVLGLAGLLFAPKGDKYEA